MTMTRAKRTSAGLLATTLLLMALSLVGATSASAAAGERIRTFDATLAIQPDASVRVSELIEYDFGSQSRRGIFRVIPVIDRFDETFDREIRINDVNVSSPSGAPSQLSIETSGGAERFRIGDPNRTVTGVQTYLIQYTVVGAMNAFDEQDELFWNVTGLDWEVPIDAATARVSAPGDIARVTCFAGAARSTAPCTSSRANGAEAVFAAKGLSPRAGLTIVVALPKGAVDVPARLLVERPSLARSFSLTPATISVALLVLVLSVGGVLRLAWTQGRDKRYVGQVPGLEPPRGASAIEEIVPAFGKDAVAVDFAPPPEVRPGIIGTLIDERANVLDVTATVIDLAVRGFLRIEEVPKEGWFGKADWRFIPLKPADNTMLAYERRLFKAITSRSDNLLSVVAKDAAADLHKVQTDLYNEVVARRWFRGRPDYVRTQWAFLGGVLAGFGALLTWALARWTTFGLVGIGIVLAGIVMLIASRRMPARTGRGTAVLTRTLGFRTYISTAEANQIRYDEREQVFSQYLPYAMVFGEAERWTKTFAAAGFGAAAGAAAGAGSVGAVPWILPWYVGANAFSMNNFGDAISAFTVTTAGSISAAASASSGSSGFGGGGFSGGGMGGGGGGSW